MYRYASDFVSVNLACVCQPLTYVQVGIHPGRGPGLPAIRGAKDADLPHVRNLLAGGPLLADMLTS